MMVLSVLSRVSPPSVDQEDMFHFSLQGLLPAEQTLALDLTTEVLALLSLRENRPLLLSTQHLTPGERCVLLPLLEAFPYYCSHEMLLASFSGFATEASIERSRKLLQEAIETGEWNHVMRPVRSTLSRVRLKLRLMGIDVVSLLATGYILRRAGAK